MICDNLDEEEEEDDETAVITFESDPLNQPSTSQTFTAIPVIMDDMKKPSSTSRTKATNNWDKFRLLMWKNFKLQVQKKSSIL